MKYKVNVPPIDSPFFKSYIDNLKEDRKASPEQIELCRQFYRNGYVVIDLDLPDKAIEKVNSDVQRILALEDVNLQADHYDYSNSPRVFQGWKKSNSIRNLACNSRILETLRILYGREPFPFSTINFIKGAQQPFHSDTIHFQTMPNGWIVGCWVALEDISIDAGPLKIAPGSHRNRTWSYQDLGLPEPDDIEDGEKKCYREYEKFIDDLVKEQEFGTKVLPVKKGSCIIWSAELLHGSIEIKDAAKTRKSQAIHYSFEGCTRYYHPMFSNLETGKFADKWCNENKNIKTHKESGATNV